MKQSRRTKSYARHSTRRGASPRDLRRIRRVIIAVGGAFLVVVAALVWGSYLQAKSDAYRATHGEEKWQVDPSVAEPLPVDAPQGNAISTKIDEWVSHDYRGAILYLGSARQEQPLPFASAVMDAAGITHGTWPLSREVDRLHGNGFTVTGVFTVTSFDEEDEAMAVYRKGVELALLTEFAQAGLNDILLVGVPMGTEALDAAAVTYLRDAKLAVTEVSETVSVGVALDADAFYRTEEETPVYSDRLSPARALTACDYLAVDLRYVGEELEGELKALSYPYVRYGLRLLLNGEDEAAEDVAMAHGFDAYMLYRPVS